MFNDCIIKNISSDAESREEQDGGKYSFVGRMTTKLQAILQVYVMKNTEKKRRSKILSLQLSLQASLIMTIRTVISW